MTSGSVAPLIPWTGSQKMIRLKALSTQWYDISFSLSLQWACLLPFPLRPPSASLAIVLARVLENTYEYEYVRAAAAFRAPSGIAAQVPSPIQ